MVDRCGKCLHSRQTRRRVNSDFPRCFRECASTLLVSQQTAGREAADIGQAPQLLVGSVNLN
jgi:hypothetical protein